LAEDGSKYNSYHRMLSLCLFVNGKSIRANYTLVCSLNIGNDQSAHCTGNGESPNQHVRDYTTGGRMYTREDGFVRYKTRRLKGKLQPPSQRSTLQLRNLQLCTSFTDPMSRYLHTAQKTRLRFVKVDWDIKSTYDSFMSLIESDTTKDSLDYMFTECSRVTSGFMFTDIVLINKNSRGRKQSDVYFLTEGNYICWRCLSAEYSPQSKSPCL
jgi:hypothetical protein